MMMTELLLIMILQGGGWVIGDRATDSVGVATVDPAGDQWPHQVRDWEYWTGDKWESDSELTVTEGKLISKFHFI